MINVTALENSKELDGRKLEFKLGAITLNV